MVDITCGTLRYFAVPCGTLWYDLQIMNPTVINRGAHNAAAIPASAILFVCVLFVCVLFVMLWRKRNCGGDGVVEDDKQNGVEWRWKGEMEWRGRDDGREASSYQNRIDV